MKLEFRFQRSVGVPPPPLAFPVLGADVPPTDAAYLLLDNVFRCPQFGPNAEALEAVAVAYDGPRDSPAITFDLYLWDEAWVRWYKFCDIQVANGEIRYAPLPNLVDRKDARQVSRIHVAIVPINPGGVPDGDYSFSFSAVTGLQSNIDPESFADIIALLTSIDNKTPALGQALMAASTPVTIASDQTPLADLKVTGTITAGGEVEINTQGRGSCVATLVDSGPAWTGTISFWGYDGTQWVPVDAITTDTVPSRILSTTANGTWRVDCSGFQKVKVLGVGVVNTAGVTLNTSVADYSAGGGGGGASVGGGNNIWSNPQDFSATANAGAKTITFAGFTSTVLSSVISTLNFTGAVIRRYNSVTGDVDVLPTTNVAYAAGVLTLADMTSNFVAGDTVLVMVPGPDKAYNESVDAVKLVNDDTVANAVRNVPVWSDWSENYTDDQSVTTAVAGTANYVAYPNFVDMRGFGWFGLEYQLIVGSSYKMVQVFATEKDVDDATSLAATDWYDVTYQLFGKSIIDNPCTCTSPIPVRVTHLKTVVTTAPGVTAANNTWGLYARKAR